MNEIRDGRHYWRERVYFDSTDAAGIVYHASYFRFADHARSEFLHLLEVAHKTSFIDRGLYIAVRHCEIDWLKPAKPEDLLTVVSIPVEMGTASFKLAQEIYRGEELLCRMIFRMVCVDAALKPQRLPEDFAAAFTTQLGANPGAPGVQ
jgi:acyl-CoA thioester hydrolase